MEHSGRPVVLLVGSAISGVAPPFLPMVWTVLREVTASMLNALEESGGGSVVLEYARCLTAGQSHHHLLESIKFEDFLFQVEACLGRTALDELLIDLYDCAGCGWGYNHAAIAHMVRSGEVKACFTTNFDNALELAWSGWTLEHERLPERIIQGQLIKLHGDAKARTCVATSPMIERPSREFSRLPDLLRDHQVLVLGYSGHGDLDIAPELEKASEQGVSFTWYTEANPKRLPPQFAKLSHTDLSRWDDSNELYRRVPNLGPLPTGGHKGREEMALESAKRVRVWAERHKQGAHRLIAAMYHWRSSWPIVHMALAGELNADSALAQAWASTQAFAEVGAFASSLCQFHNARRLAAQTSISEQFQFQIDGHEGFCRRQLGDNGGAVRALRPAVDRILATGESSQKMYKSALCRQYLESCRDTLYATPPWKRRSLSSSMRVMQVVQQVERWGHLAPSPENKLRQQIVCTELLGLVGEPNYHELVRLNERAMESAYYGAAAAAARAIVLQFGLGKREQLRATTNKARESTRDFRIVIKYLGCLALASVGNQWWIRRVAEPPARLAMMLVAEFRLAITRLRRWLKK